MEPQKDTSEARHIAESRREYAEAFSEGGESLDTLMWSSAQAQQGRFAVLADIADLNDASVLDVGCGFAHLRDVLLGRYSRVSYTGLELVDAIARAARRRVPDAEILNGTLETLEPGRLWDYVMQSGVFNIGCFDFAAAEDMIRRMFARARRGVAVNFLSMLSSGDFNPEAAYYDPADIVSLAARLSRRFTLRHDYRNNDFTLYLWHALDAPGTELEKGEIQADAVRRPR